MREALWAAHKLSIYYSVHAWPHVTLQFKQVIPDGVHDIHLAVSPPLIEKL